MNFKKLVLTASFIATTAVAGTIATAARADTFNVYTGYADSLRPTGFFPTPWLGNAGVVSQSAANQSDFDSGAVRIQNTGSTAITVSNFTVTLYGGATFAFWNPLTIGAGQNGIFAATFPDNFDSSDFSGNGGPVGGIQASDPGSNGIGGCSSTAATLATAGLTAYCAARTPTVSFDTGAGHFSFSDNGHILDTGFYDFVNNNVDGNESINWNDIGGAANRGGTVPEPTTWALMIGGFGIAGAALRRRRSAVAA
ncbi:MAG: PEPxxWA-CTERM sorting domain-containing protein [Phenylobacterium sp.]